MNEFELTLMGCPWCGARPEVLMDRAPVGYDNSYFGHRVHVACRNRKCAVQPSMTTSVGFRCKIGGSAVGKSLGFNPAYRRALDKLELKKAKLLENTRILWNTRAHLQPGP